jgi:DNA polymerase III psi subunit
MKTNYLQAMGIVSWRLREPLSRQQQPCVMCYGLGKGGEIARSGSLIAETGSAPEKQLLTAILEALAVKNVVEIPAPASRFFLMGAHLAQRYEAFSSKVVTHSLAEILENSQLKAKVWKDLRDFFHM